MGINTNSRTLYGTDDKYSYCMWTEILANEHRDKNKTYPKPFHRAAAMTYKEVNHFCQ